MSVHFESADAKYDPTRDIRNWSEILDKIRLNPPHDGARYLVAPRRHGKTWALEAIEHHLKNEFPGRVYNLSRNSDVKAFWDDEPFPLMLVDEPGFFMAEGGSQYRDDQCRKLLDRFRVLNNIFGFRVVVALTPAEFELLRAIPGYDLKKVAFSIRRLSPEETSKMGERASAWAPNVIAALSDDWRSNPFLLELVLEVAQNNPDLRSDVKELMNRAVRFVDSDADYFKHVWGEGLSDRQKDLILRVARNKPILGEFDPSLLNSGLVVKNGEELEIADPVLKKYIPPPLRIHHLSDIHVGPKSATTGGEKVRDSVVGVLVKKAGGAKLIRDTYVDFLKAKPHERPHLIVISGDLAERGEKELYDEFTEWLNRIDPHLIAGHPDIPDGAPRVLLVGGNHDVDWKVTILGDGARKRHQPFAEAFTGRMRPPLEDPPETRKLAVVDYPDAYLEFCLFGSAECGGEVDTDDAAKRLNISLSEIQKNIAKAIDERNWDVVKTLQDQFSRFDPGLVHQNEIERINGAIKKRPVRIAVLHHPISPLPYPDVSHFAGVVNAGSFKKAMFENQFALVLHGHMHAAWYAEESWPNVSDDWIVRIAAAGSLGTTEREERNGFNEIILTRFRGDCELEVYKREYDANWSGRKLVMGPFRPGQPRQNSK